MLEPLILSVCLGISNKKACETSLMAYYMGSPAKSTIEKRLETVDKRLFFILATALNNDILIPVTENFSVGKTKVLFSYGF